MRNDFIRSAEIRPIHQPGAFTLPPPGGKFHPDFQTPMTHKTVIAADAIGFDEGGWNFLWHRCHSHAVYDTYAEFG